MKAEVARILRGLADRLAPREERVVNITVNSVTGDPVRVGREIERVLAAYRRSTGL